MDKMTAVRVLISRSSLLTHESKHLLEDALSSMSDEEIEQLGVFLAQEKVQSIEDAKEGMARVDAVLLQMDALERQENKNTPHG